MKKITDSLTTLYARLLRLYPRRFRDEFAGEMETVFRELLNEAFEKGILSLLDVSIKELGGLPLSIMREFWHEFGRKETVMVTSEKMEPAYIPSTKASHWEAFLSALPFVLFGIASMYGKSTLPFHMVYPDMTFYVIILVGLLVGLTKGIPRWTYSYLGWSLVFAWWWTDMRTYGFYWFFGDTREWGWWIWLPLFIAFAISILLTRSIRPLRQLVLGIWQDWTLLSLALYSFIGLTMLLYDEVRAPYTIAFMIVSTLLISASVWIFMRCESHVHRLGILLGGFFTGLLMDRIVAATWDFNAYYGLPPQPPMPWYSSLLEMIFYTVLWSPIVWLPALVGLFKSTFNKEPKT